MNHEENIQKEIEKVNERISSKKELLSKHPNDKGLILSLKSFEKRKDDLTHELNQSNDRTLEEELEHIQNLILENEKLQKQFPNEKNKLKKTLTGLKKLENEIFKKIKQYNKLNIVNLKIKSKD